MTRASRVACLLVGAAVVLGSPAAASAAPAENSNGMRYKVLVFTDPAAGTAASSPAIKALRALGQERRFAVVATSDPAKLAEEDVSEYGAVVFLNTSVDVLDGAGQAEFEEYFRAGGGFVGIGSAIESEPEWPFLTELFGARAAGQDRRSSRARSRSPTASMTRQGPAGVLDAHRRLVQLHGQRPRRSATCSPPSSSDPLGPQPQGRPLDGIDGGTMGADHPVAWCKDYRGGRSFYTSLGNTAASFNDAG